MGMGFAPTWLRQVSPPPASQNHFITTELQLCALLRVQSKLPHGYCVSWNDLDQSIWLLLIHIMTMHSNTVDSLVMPLYYFLRQCVHPTARDGEMLSVIILLTSLWYVGSCFLSHRCAKFVFTVKLLLLAWLYVMSRSKLHFQWNWPSRLLLPNRLTLRMGSRP